jgi:hypothetical protein
MRETALATKIRDGGVAVNTTVWMDPPSDEPATCAASTLRPQRLRVHAKSEAGELPGKVVILP